MNNKKLGTAFEQEFCEFLAEKGYWVHFITPDKAGAQPFDVIAVKDGKAFAVDCKTCSKDYFSISRLEDNQRLAFDRWIECGNEEPMIAIKYKDNIYIVKYNMLKYWENVSIISLWTAEEVFKW